MELCFIVPRRWFRLSKEYSDFYLPIAHQIKESDKDLFQDKYCVLDNGAFELGGSIDEDELLEIAKWLEPNEVVVPDVIHDANATMESASRFFSKCPVDYNYMFVPQGKTWEEWLKCYRWALNHSFVDVIGFLCKVPFELDSGTAEVLNKPPQTLIRFEMVNKLKDMNLLSKPIHILGSIDPIELPFLNRFPQVIRTDSKIAFWNGMHGKVLDEETGAGEERVWEEMPFGYRGEGGYITGEQYSMAKINMDIYKRLGKGTR